MVYIYFIFIISTWISIFISYFADNGIHIDSMPIPIGKAFMTFFRYILRPINNTLIRKFKVQHGVEK